MAVPKRPRRSSGTRISGSSVRTSCTAAPSIGASAAGRRSLTRCTSWPRSTSRLAHRALLIDRASATPSTRRGWAGTKGNSTVAGSPPVASGSDGIRSGASPAPVRRWPSPKRDNAPRRPDRRASADVRLREYGRAGRRGPAPAGRLSDRPCVRGPRPVRARLPSAHMTETPELVSPDSRARLLAAWEPHWDLAKTVLVEKSPPNLIRTRFLQALFPGATFAIVVRHPIPVTLATARWRGTRRLAPLVEHWLRCHELFADDEPQSRARTGRSLRGARRRRRDMRPAHLGARRARAGPGRDTGGAGQQRGLLRAMAGAEGPAGRAGVPGADGARYERRVERFGYSLRDPGGPPNPWCP